MNSHKLTAKENKEKFINKKTRVFVNEKLAENLFKARDENYNIVLVKSEENILGKEIEVKITGVGVHNLVGEIT